MCFVILLKALSWHPPPMTCSVATKLGLAAAVLAGVLLAPQLAHAEVKGSLGVKALLGGSVWSTPADIPGGYEGIGFAGSGGGFGYNGAVYGELRIAEYLGLELDLGYDHTTLRRQVTYNSVVDVDEKVTLAGFRGALLVKGIVPTSFGRFWVGLGLEQVSGNDVDAALDAEGGVDVKTKIYAKDKSSRMLAMGLGVVVHAGELIEIPVELRASKNLSQDAAWEDRVALDMVGANLRSYEVTAQSSWDFRLGVGIGARF